MRVISLFIGSGDPNAIWTSPIMSSERQQMNKLNGNKSGMVLLNRYFLTSNLFRNSRNEDPHMMVGRSGQGPSPAPVTCHYSVSVPSPANTVDRTGRPAGTLTVTLCESTGRKTPWSNQGPWRGNCYIMFPGLYVSNTMIGTLWDLHSIFYLLNTKELQNPPKTLAAPA